MSASMNKNKKAALAATSAACSSKIVDSSQASAQYRRDFLRYHAYLNRLRAIHMGDIPEPDGSFYGDGIPRTAGGYEFTPLDWGKVMQA